MEQSLGSSKPFKDDTIKWYSSSLDFCSDKDTESKDIESNDIESNDTESEDTKSKSMKSQRCYDLFVMNETQKIDGFRLPKTILVDKEDCTIFTEQVNVESGSSPCHTIAERISEKLFVSITSDTIKQMAKDGKILIYYAKGEDRHYYIFIQANQEIKDFVQNSNNPYIFAKKIKTLQGSSSFRIWLCNTLERSGKWTKKQIAGTAALVAGLAATGLGAWWYARQRKHTIRKKKRIREVYYDPSDPDFHMPFVTKGNKAMKIALPIIQKYVITDPDPIKALDIFKNYATQLFPTTGPKLGGNPKTYFINQSKLTTVLLYVAQTIKETGADTEELNNVLKQAQLYWMQFAKSKHVYARRQDFVKLLKNMQKS